MSDDYERAVMNEIRRDLVESREREIAANGAISTLRAENAELRERLEATEREAAPMRRRAEAAERGWDEARARATAAEAERDRLRGLLEDMIDEVPYTLRRYEAREKAIAYLAAAPQTGPDPWALLERIGAVSGVEEGWPHCEACHGKISLHGPESTCPGHLARAALAAHRAPPTEETPR